MTTERWFDGHRCVWRKQIKRVCFCTGREYMWKSVSAVSGHIRGLVFLKSLKSWASRVKLSPLMPGPASLVGKFGIVAARSCRRVYMIWLTPINICRPTRVWHRMLAVRKTADRPVGMLALEPLKVGMYPSWTYWKQTDLSDTAKLALAWCCFGDLRSDRREWDKLAAPNFEGPTAV